VIAARWPGLSTRQLIAELSSTISAAGAAILAECRASLNVRAKADDSPVTNADHASEAVMLEGIARVLPGVPVISEEAGCAHSTISGMFVLVDPLDGTRELVAGRDEFTINLAIIEGGRPQLGIIAAPARGLIWRGIAGAGAERLRLAAGEPASCARDRVDIRTRPCPRSGLVALVSRSHLDAQSEALLARLPLARRVACGSAIKFCLLAQGEADIYPRLSTTFEWDIAAGEAIISAAGGRMRAPEGSVLVYGRIDRELRVPGFVAWGDPREAEDRGRTTDDR
jgi:3'(2'), 5'-bisphosphate nucleotidase